ncbi:unnamed protein product [Acanthoscelides obtectus]|uniref:Uncharacterized protein n=1 Tax=Acanthoscelides obtectus TaxID=200917 RepID=A0A9P0JQT7_ACAOB|nr:unnamed protein product [Acanthoscelides obtectus]CAK1667967.1 hypothetical protein AOBTE_LOCUS26145 [Acanthoscelides obtectus]
MNLAQMVTREETWVHHWDPETKTEYKQWVHEGSPGKLITTVFWDRLKNIGHLR